jgi:hypothetical protein
MLACARLPANRERYAAGLRAPMASPVVAVSDALAAGRHRPKASISPENSELQRVARCEPGGRRFRSPGPRDNASAALRQYQRPNRAA